MALGFSEVLARFGPHKHAGKEYRVTCPAHDDQTPSLDITEGDNGAPLFQCRSAHCQSGDILAAVGLTWRDVMPPSLNGHRDDWDHVYEYKDRAGTLRYRVFRRNAHGTKEKVIRQQAASGAWSLKDITPLPYRLPELAGPTVLVAEGEKAVDALMAAGYEATTNSGGALNWHDSDTQALKDIGIAALVILPDNDDPGLRHAAKVEASAARLGLTTRRVILPGLPPGGDAADWLQAHTPDDLEAALVPAPPPILPDLADAVDVAAEGRKIAEDGIRYFVEGLIPDYGMLGFLTAAAKVGKSSLGLFLASCVARGQPCFGLEVEQRRVLIIAAEDPREYVAYLARHLDVPRGLITFYRAPIQLNAEGLARIASTVKAGRYGLVLIASWQAVVSGLVKDENDNAGSVKVVEAVKQTVHADTVPWLIDAHAGKSEDQGDDADPTKALRGASAAAGAADFLLSLRYADGPFSTRRRLSGKGRFVNAEPITIDYTPRTGQYSGAATESQSVHTETTWALILETGALTGEWAGVAVIAKLAGLAPSASKVTGSAKRAISRALHGRPGVERMQSGENTWKFRIALDA